MVHRHQKWVVGLKLKMWKICRPLDFQFQLFLQRALFRRDRHNIVQRMGFTYRFPKISLAFRKVPWIPGISARLGRMDRQFGIISISISIIGIRLVILHSQSIFLGCGGALFWSLGIRSGFPVLVPIWMQNKCIWLRYDRQGRYFSYSGDF